MRRHEHPGAATWLTTRLATAVVATSTLVGTPLAGTAAAQAAAPSDSLLPAGTTVRVTMGVREPMIGTVTRLRADTLMFELRRTSRLFQAPLDSVTRLEVKTGTRKHVGRSAMRGVLIGGGVGALSGILVAIDDSEGWLDYGAEAIPIGAAGGALWGGAIGTLFGLVGSETIWEPVPVAALRVGLRAGSGGSVGARIEIRWGPDP